MIPFDERDVASHTTSTARPQAAIRGNWAELQRALVEAWPRLTIADVLHIAGGRDALMRVLRRCYGKSYGQIDRDVTEFEFREVRAANTARHSQGIQNDR